MGYAGGVAIGFGVFLLLFRVIDLAFGVGGKYEKHMEFNERNLFELKRRNAISEMMELHLRVIAKCMKREDDAYNA
jgi:hypothetical protein